LSEESNCEMWPIISHQQINERIYELLLSKIVTQELTPGQKLQSVEEIASALGVSRTPVKDAVNRLAVEGLLTIIPRKGTFVTDVTPEGIEELFDVRLMMELHAAALALERITDEEIEKLSQLLLSCQKLVDGDRYMDYEAFLDLDTDFHLSLFQSAGNSLLLKLYEGINLHLQVVRAYQKAPGAAAGAAATQAEHNAILSALRGRDVGALQDALTAHITNRRAQFTRALENSRKR
jgi:DNA-binding GntR family transcriptional regulator